MKKSVVINFFCLLLGMFLAEMIFKFINGSDILTIDTVRILMGLGVLSGVLSFVFSFLKEGLAKFFVVFANFLVSFYASIQLGFDNFIGVYISFQTSSQLGAVKDYISDFVRSFEPIFFMPFLSFVLVLLICIFFRKRLRGEHTTVKPTLRFILPTLMVCLSCYMATIIMPALQDQTLSVGTKELFLTASNPSLTVEQYGTTGFCLLDVKAMLFPVTIEEEYKIEKPQKQEKNPNSRIIDDTKWLSVIEEEDNKTMNALNNYFINQDITDKNEFTGMFKGKNLIVIMMESVNDIFINEKYYPNFYKMVNEGWYWENNYSPRNSCATMNNEFSGMTSLYSIYNTCTASKYRSNRYYESLFNLYNNKNYVTFSAHDYTQAYYPRKTIHKNMGSGEYYGVEKLGIKYSNEYVNWANDDDFMKAMLKIIDKKTANGQPFMTWLTTVSSHQPYTSSSIQGNKYYDMTKGTGYPTDVRRFMSKLKILDKGLGLLMDGLKKRGILDDTVIVLYGDHYPYGISTRNLNKVLDYDTSKYYNAERVPFVIYNSKMKAKTYSEYTSYLNIVPTLANLFDLNYDPRLYLGHDLLSKDYQSRVVFADGSWKNEIGFYNARKNKMTYFSSVEYDKSKIAEINKEIKDKIDVSNKVIKNNYFSYLDKKLNKEEEE